MKRMLFCLLALAATGAQAAVGVSVSVGEPGFYGRIDIGDFPRPALIYADPIIVHRVGRPPAPVYLHVPPGHAKRWRHYCREYDACGVPVYFVQDRWYNEVYVPRYREREMRRTHRDHHDGPPPGHGEHGPHRD